MTSISRPEQEVHNSLKILKQDVKKLFNYIDFISF